VVFSTNVTGVAASNFTLVQAGGVSGAGPVLVAGSGTTYTVSANTGSGSGTLGLNLSSAGSIKDSSNKGLTGVPYTGPVYTVDKTAPSVSAPALASSSPSNAASVAWTVTFSEPVKNVAQGQFALVVSGLGGSPAITGFSGSGATYTLTASTGTGSGSLRLDMTSKTGITDLAGNALSTAMPQTGAVYSVDKVPPAAPSIATGPSGSGNPASATFSFTNNDTAAVTYLCKLDAGSYTACSNPVTFSGLADGSHTLLVEAKDAAGNVSATAASRTWSVDATGPPKPTVSGPNNNNPSTSATFTFSDTEANVTFKCQMDGGGYTPCTSPKTYLLTAGTHVFDVEPIDQVGNVGPFNEWKWTISGNSGAGLPFTIDGNAVGLLYPGVTTPTPIAVTFHNPNSVPIYVTAFTTGLNASLLPAGCLSSWFPISQSNISGSNAVKVPAKVGSVNGSVTLPHANSNNNGTVTAPTILMTDSGNQNVCHDANLQITYTLGSAQS
jgi:hypothetical protein